MKPLNIFYYNLWLNDDDKIYFQVEVTSNLKTTAADLTKIYYAIEISPDNIAGNYSFYSYYQVSQYSAVDLFLVRKPHTHSQSVSSIFFIM